MQAWLVLFFVLFGATELFQWVAGLNLPVPFFMVSGVLLAIASNANKPVLPWKTPSVKLPQKPSVPTSAPASTPVSTAPATHTAESVAAPPAATMPERSISFTIRKPTQRGHQ